LNKEASMTLLLKGLSETLKGTITNSINDAIVEKIGIIVAKETRRVLLEHEGELVTLVRVAVAQAITETLTREGTNSMTTNEIIAPPRSLGEIASESPHPVRSRVGGL
jgi:hypothetical protein